ncbi:MAG: GNAT family N-acetyltransferase [Gemmatimonadetes bacterium]|nr:GNAT family N-acetyltransferase [Gemmatimonadota bacterium]MCY3613274.1 GNAT family N-acetyltransferase [Gemmatimonadota bacterium]MCY3679568.1 GNAT family N-acetyltransferase [Gemmatimonadota bacterium]MYA42140.1 GNAT family N-acetyltransferase [Gemmatimonadota bacterium]MYE92039.1 GNAT family N-acetyltransferase [Gemmatimonadota bacterium]
MIFRPVTPERWTDFERLFEARGGPKYCWCMVGRRDDAGRSPRTNAERKQAMRSKIRCGTPVGILAYDGGEPVAWCSVAPRETLSVYRGLEWPEGDPSTVWSITCFYVKRGIRRSGVMSRLIEEAVAHAGRNGARVVEAYPVAPDSPSYRFCGFVPVFAERGFVEVGRAGVRRHVMRRELRGRGIG